MLTEGTAKYSSRELAEKIERLGASLSANASDDFLVVAGSSLSIYGSEVLQLIAEGQTMKVAAARLGISTRTAESHKYEIMRQLGVRTTADLIRYAVRSNLTGL